ncbi:hypothetical protein G9F71_016170 [Clostridium sp. FP2]|uniref:hypothetical protein n=1 Tax=Clostridium sp. FP2 TaxID=2724481 RepID=UPI0013E9606A|nr:hypothetical protein [Clostridium sp. FP2]MBZ9624389.1 hypothetical protein [Clostridium sp. FP2]
MANLNMKTVTLNAENNRLMNVFKTIINKEETANILANKTVTKGIEENSPVLQHFYGEDEPAIVTASCISFGLINFMAEDFYTVKEVLGYNYVLKLLHGTKNFISIVK